MPDKNEKELITVPCKALGEKRGRYYVTEAMRDAAIHLIALVEPRKAFERTRIDRERHAAHIKSYLKESNPVWEKLLSEFEEINDHLSEQPRMIAYRHFMTNMRRELGYPELDNPR